MTHYKLNPLEIPLVARNVFRCLDKRSLLSCRLVNKSWNTGVCEILKMRKKGLPELILRNQTHVTTFIASFENSIPGISNVPYSLCYSIDAEQSDELQIRQDQEDLERILNLGPENIVKLTLELSRPRSRPLLLLVDEFYDEEEATEIVVQLEQVLEILFNRCENIHSFELSETFQGTLSISPVEWQRVIDRYAGRILPKLRDIRVAVNWVRPAWRNKFSTVVSALMGMLIENAVQLQSFKLDGEYGQSENFLLQTIISNLRSSRLEKFKVYFFAISDETLLSLSTHVRGFPLLSIVSLEIDGSVTLSDVKTFLARYSKSLVKLHLENMELEMQNFPLGVTMEKLIRLKFKNFRGSIKWEKVPKLKEVILENSWLQGIAESIISSPSHSNLACIKIEGKSTTEPPMEFHKLFAKVAPHIFPNLVNLYVSHITSLPVEIIFSECKLLQSLKLWGSIGVSDSAICGVNASKLNITWPSENDFERCADEDEKQALYEPLLTQAKRCDFPKRPYIGNLKELRNLQIMDWEAEFSEVAVLFGIIHCEKLEEIALHSVYLCTQHSTRVILQTRLANLATLELNGRKILK